MPIQIKLKRKKTKLNLKDFKPEKLSAQRPTRGPPTIMFVGGRGSGKCLGKGTPVMMYNGKLKEVQNIVTGDVVMGDDSTPRNVMNVCKGVGELFKVHQNNSDNYTVNKDHVLSLYVSSINSVSRNNNKPCMIDIYGSRYSKGDIIDIPIQKYLQLSKTTQRARLKGYKQKVFFQKRDFDQHNVYEQAVKFARNPVDDLDERLYINDNDTRVTFLAGLVDTHAHHSGDSKSLEFCKTDPRILKIASFVGRTLGYLCNFTRDNRLIISGPELYKLPNKFPVKEYTGTKNHMITGIKVQSIGEGEYFGFELDGNHRFLLGDCTVTHNSHACKEILSYISDIPTGIVMSGTQEGYEEFSQHVPSSFVYEGVKPEIIKGLIAQQKKIMRTAGKRIHRTKDLDTMLLLEDCMADKTHYKKKEFNDIFMNGRHLGICLVMTMQYCMDIPPGLRGNIDYVFATAEIKTNMKKKLYEHYFNVFPTYKAFDAVFTKATRNHGILVLDTTDIGKSTALEDMLFRYKARPSMKPFKFGSGKFWKMHKKIVRDKKEKKRRKIIKDRSGIMQINM
jgi:hypothetical protein